MGCVQSTGVDSEAKARAYSSTPHLNKTSVTQTRFLQAMMRLKTNSDEIE
jgi:hypothetical protein